MTAENTLPLVVDLDGTLIRTDSLWEGVLATLRQAPWLLVMMPLWVFRGKAYFKKRIAKSAPLEVAMLPYDPEVLAYIQQAVDAGRPVALVTAANQRVADAVSAHLGLFGLAKGSNSRLNLGGKTKAIWLEQMYPLGFEYIGDRHVDVPVWRAATVATVAGRDAEALHKLHLAGHDSAQILPGYAPMEKGSLLRNWFSAARVHQWSKNLLLLVPFIMAGSMVHWSEFFNVALAIFSFSLLASATYIINDLLDLPNDRQHPIKSKRVLASCVLTIPQGIAGVALLLLASASILFVLGSWDFALMAISYAVITLSYSFYFKREAMLDVMVLSGLYTLRISAGAVVLSMAVSWWLVSFSFLFFLSLALMKRYAELELMKRSAAFISGRNYRIEDMPLLQVLGIGASFAAVVLFIIYLVLEHFSYQMFSHPGWLWPIAILTLLWQARLWMVTSRGDMHQDPIYFALKDRGSLKLGALCLLLIMMAW